MISTAAMIATTLKALCSIGPIVSDCPKKLARTREPRTPISCVKPVNAMRALRTPPVMRSLLAVAASCAALNASVATVASYKAPATC